MSERTRIVVGEGPSTRKGLLGFVLSGEGYDVVGEASTSAELARVAAARRPDVVVLDDGIGAMAVAMIRETLPSAHVILVWPGDVVPIGGDARVEPSDVLRELGRAVERLTGQPRSTLGREAFDPEPRTRSRPDPARLREILARGAAAQLERSRPDRGADPAAVVTLRATLPADDDVVVIPDLDDLDSATGPVQRAGDGARRFPGHTHKR